MRGSRLFGRHCKEQASSCSLTTLETSRSKGGGARERGLFDMRFFTVLPRRRSALEETDVRLPTYDEIARDRGQLGALEYPLDRSLFVVGPPGSGKTILAVRRARMAAEQ